MVKISLASVAGPSLERPLEGMKELRVLLVEDEARMSKLVSRALVRAGFVVDAFDTCADGREALSLIHYDAAILDLGLPDGDGLTLLTATRSNSRNIPILVLTARDTVEDRVSGLDAGADDYLVKPFAMSELIARTKALLRRPGNALGTLLNAGNVTFDSIGRDVKIGDVAIALGIKYHSGSRSSSSTQAARCRRHCSDSHSAGSGLPPRRIENMIQSWLRSLQLRLAMRVAALYIVATVVVIVVLMSRAYDTARSLSDQELVFRAADLARYVSVGANGLPRFDLPPNLTAVYDTAPGSDIFAIRDAGGRVIAAAPPQFGDLVAGWPRATVEPAHFSAQLGTESGGYDGLGISLNTVAGPVIQYECGCCILAAEEIHPRYHLGGLVAGSRRAGYWYPEHSQWPQIGSRRFGDGGRN